jgi:MoaA/NifB/PqqE/SkfB family radical SAM enzyme
MTRLTPAADGSLSTGYRNYFLNSWEFAQGAEIVRSTPPSIQIASNNNCNFSCVYCADHRAGNHVPRLSLTHEVRDRLDPLVDQALAASFHGISEFFLEKQFFAIVERCGRAGTILSLNTNGSVCTDRHVAALVDYPNPIAINFSLDAATPETFRRIRGWDFWRVIRNIQTYMTALAQRRHRILATTSFVVCSSNRQEMLPFVYLSRSLGMDGLKFYPLIDEANHDWRIETKEGGTFDYRAEMTNPAEPSFRQQVEQAREAAALLGMYAELPDAAPPPPEPEFVPLSPTKLGGQENP